MKRFAPLALVAALALAGCTAGNQSADATPSATATPSASATVAPASAKVANVKQSWADRKVVQFLNGNGANSFSAFKGQALGDIETWDSHEKGNLNLHLKNDSWSKSDLQYIAESFMSSVGYESKDLNEVTVSAGDSGKKVNYGRQDMENANPWSK